MIRIGVLGAGNHSSELHGAALKLLADRDPGRFEIAAICDIDSDRARSYQGRFSAGRVYTDLDEMLAAERFDGFMAITPMDLTEPIVSRLLGEGMGLLIEKPPGETPKATERLRDLAARHNARHMVSFNRRFCPALVKAREWMAASPELRKPLFVLGRMLRRNRLESDFITGTAIHQFDAIVSILGPPTRLSTSAVPTGKEGVSIVHSRIGFSGGRKAACLIAPDAGVLTETYEIVGQGWSLEIDALSGKLRIRDGGADPITWQAPPDAPRQVTDGTVNEMEAFLRALEGRGPWWPTLDDSLASMRATHAAAAGGEHDFS